MIASLQISAHVNVAKYFKTAVDFVAIAASKIYYAGATIGYLSEEVRFDSASIGSHW